MNNAPIYKIDFSFSVSVEDGLKPILQTLLKLKTETGIHIDEETEWIMMLENGRIDEAYRISYADAKDVMTGQLTDSEYMERNVVVRNGKAIDEERYYVCKV